MEIQMSIRYRVNVSQTSTGKKSWDCTVDAEGCPMSLALEDSDALVAELEKRYPYEIPEPKIKEAK